MKKNGIIKFGVIAVIITMLASSCSVTYRQRHHHVVEKERVVVP